MILNPGKSHYILIGNNSHDDIILNGVGIKISKKKKLLEALIDKNLSSDIHRKSIFRKTS